MTEFPPEDFCLKERCPTAVRLEQLETNMQLIDVNEEDYRKRISEERGNCYRCRATQLLAYQQSS